MAGNPEPLRCHFCGSERPDLAWMVTLSDTCLLVCPKECESTEYQFLRAMGRLRLCEQPARGKAE